MYALARRGILLNQTLGRPSRVSGSEIDLNAVFDHLTDGVVVLDTAQNVILMNQAAAEILGMERGSYAADLLAQTFDIFSAADEPVPHERWPSGMALRGQFVSRLELKIRRRDTGAMSMAEITTFPITDANGETAQVLIHYRDVRERIRSDHLQLRLAAIVESSEDAIIGKDERGIVVSWNRGAEKVFGYPAAEMIGQSIQRLIPPDRLDEEDQIMARIRAGETVGHLETTRLRKDGKVIVMSLTISPIRDPWGRIIGASKVGRDITVQRQLERKVHQGQKMAAIGQLTGGIAHDFNNLLGVVIGSLDLLEPMIEENAPALKRMRTAQKAALRGADLTGRLLAFSSHDALNPTLTSLEESIHNTLELAGKGLGPEVEIVTEFDPNVPDVMVDRPGLEALLLNLAVNAGDAMPEGGTLTVTTRLMSVETNSLPLQMGELKAGDYVCVSVSDTGHGMSRETQERVFEPFFTTKPRGRGTGLGLSMAYGFVKQSGGAVKIYSELGIGTNVSFFLPVHEPQLPEAAVLQGGATQVVNLNGCTVLLVDDEEDLLEIASAYAEELGCKVLTAIDGQRALEILESPVVVHVMLTDIIMPGGITGAALAQRARILRPELKIVYTSGLPVDALAERKSLALNGPLLRKPYQRADVQAFLRRAMSKDTSSGGTSSA
jgi:PAS domain S-box-containing protein